MGLVEFYAQIRLVHITCVCASGGLFALRGGLALTGVQWTNHLALRVLSWTIDTVLLTAALMLLDIVHQYPFVDAWLTTKVLLLAAYVLLGSFALRRARTRRGRALAYGAALLVFGWIASVAHWHEPLAPLRMLTR